MSRQTHLESAFSTIPSNIGTLDLRPLSAGSFTLLSRLGNPMVNGDQAEQQELDETAAKARLFDAVIQYVYIHHAPLEEVCAIIYPEDIPAAKLSAVAFQVTMDDVVTFLASFQAASERMAASLTEIEPDKEDKPGKPEPSLAGLPASSTPAVPAVIPSGSDTSSGSCPSSVPSPISTQPTSPTEQSAGGLAMLPDLRTTETPPSVSTPPYNSAT